MTEMISSIRITFAGHGDRAKIIAWRDGSITTPPRMSDAELRIVLGQAGLMICAAIGRLGNVADAVPLTALEQEQADMDAIEREQARRNWTAQEIIDREG